MGEGRCRLNTDTLLYSECLQVALLEKVQVLMTKQNSLSLRSAFSGRKGVHESQEQVKSHLASDASEYIFA